MSRRASAGGIARTAPRPPARRGRVGRAARAPGRHRHLQWYRHRAATRKAIPSSQGRGRGSGAVSPVRHHVTRRALRPPHLPPGLRAYAGTATPRRTRRQPRVTETSGTGGGTGRTAPSLHCSGRVRSVTVRSGQRDLHPPTPDWRSGPGHLRIDEEPKADDVHHSSRCSLTPTGRRRDTPLSPGSDRYQPGTGVPGAAEARSLGAERGPWVRTQPRPEASTPHERP